MDKILVAVGSTRRPKLDAVREALQIFGPSLDPSAPFEVVGVETESEVSHTPLSRLELMAGARKRAETLAKQARDGNLPWKYFVGLEGGLDVVVDKMSGSRSRLVFLESWAYALGTSGHGSFGQSGAVVVPDELVRQVIDEGVELGVAIDAFAGGNGIRDSQGSWGVLTRNFVTRQAAFRIAVINAFAPFYNTALYSSSR